MTHSTVLDSKRAYDLLKAIEGRLSPQKKGTEHEKAPPLQTALTASISALLPSFYYILDDEDRAAQNSTGYFSSIFPVSSTLMSQDHLDIISRALHSMNKSLSDNVRDHFTSPFHKYLDELYCAEEAAARNAASIFLGLQLENGQSLFGVLMETRQRLQLERVKSLSDTIHLVATKKNNAQTEVIEVTGYTIPLTPPMTLEEQLHACTIVNIHPLTSDIVRTLDSLDNAKDKGLFFDFYGHSNKATAQRYLHITMTSQKSLLVIEKLLKSIQASLEENTFFYFLRELDRLSFDPKGEAALIFQKLQLDEKHSLYDSLMETRGSLLLHYKDCLFPNTDNPVSLAAIWAKMGTISSAENNPQKAEVISRQALPTPSKPRSITPPINAEAVVKSVLILLNNFHAFLDAYHERKYRQHLAFVGQVLARTGLGDSLERAKQASDLKSVVSKTRGDFCLETLLGELTSCVETTVAPQSELYTKSNQLLKNMAQATTSAQGNSASSMLPETMRTLQAAMSQVNQATREQWVSDTKSTHQPTPKVESTSWLQTMFPLMVLFAWIRKAFNTAQHTPQKNQTPAVVSDLYSPSTKQEAPSVGRVTLTA